MLINGDSCTNFSSDMSIEHGNESYFYDGVEPVHDFLAELSRDLDIPMLLDSDPLSHFLEEITPDEIISDCTGLHENSLDKNVLQSDNWHDDPFLSLMVPKSKENIKHEYTNTDKAINMDYDINYFVKQEMNDFKNEPFSPQRNTPSPSDSNSSRDYNSETNISDTGVILNKSTYNNNLDTPPISPQGSLTQITPENCSILPSTVITSYNPGSVQLIRIQDNIKLVQNSTKRPAIIQPKPTASINKINKNKNSLVLSPQQFAALAKSGKLQNKINDIKQDLAMMKTQKPILIKSETNTTASDIKSNLGKAENIIDNKGSSLLSIGNDFESRAIKKHQRMIKNRESACLSRKKKKEYVTSLESKIAELTLENSQLKLENTQLKARLESSLNESSNAGNKVFSSFAKTPNMKKNTAFLLAMVVMVSLNIGTIGNLFMVSPKLSSLENELADIPVGGRHLLWVADENLDYPNYDLNSEDLKTNITTTAAKFDRDTVKALDQPICPMFINVSESLRLESELRRWIGAPNNKINNETQDQYKNLDLTINLLNDYPKPRLIKRSLNENKIKKPKLRRRKITIKPDKNYAIDENKNELDVFLPQAQNFGKYLEFYEAINRRDDTFYVVSFNYDHLLLPALAHNNTLRPKMSLLMPILGANDSDSNDQVKMMQIDCEVIDTSLVHVNYKSIPRHLRPNNVNNSSTDNNVSEQEQNITGDKMGKIKNEKYPYKPYFIRKSYRTNLLTQRLNGTN